MLESLQVRKINAIMWQAVPNIDNTLCKKCSPSSTAGMWFDYFVLFIFLPRNATQTAVMRLYVVCLSVCLSVRDVEVGYIDFHTGWNTSKIISRPNSLRPMRLVTPTWEIRCNGNTPKLRME